MSTCLNASSGSPASRAPSPGTTMSFSCSELRPASRSPPSSSATVASEPSQNVRPTTAACCTRRRSNGSSESSPAARRARTLSRRPPAAPPPAPPLRPTLPPADHRVPPAPPGPPPARGSGARVERDLDPQQPPDQRRAAVARLGVHVLALAQQVADAGAQLVPGRLGGVAVHDPEFGAHDLPERPVDDARAVREAAALAKGRD